MAPKPKYMAAFSSKELYLMNGGNKIYIHKDGFGDDYHASPAEEAAWSMEVIAAALITIDTNTNIVSIKTAIDNLLFHNYPGVEALLLDKVESEVPLKQVFFAAALWRNFRYTQSFEILQNHAHSASECIDSVFLSLGDFKDNTAAKTFVLECIAGDDELLCRKANMTLGMWAYSGMSRLRENNLLEALQPENRNKETFNRAVGELKQILDGR
jgi:hypothetical protein